LLPFETRSAYKELLEKVSRQQSLPGLGLPRAARLPVLTQLFADLKVPALLITARTDQALTLFDEIGFWAPDSGRIMFPEPTPLFYEQAAWGNSTRRDRLQVMTMLARYHIPGAPKPPTFPLIVAPIRAIMTRTLPRRDFLKAARTIKTGQQVAPEALLRYWVTLGYLLSETVLECGMFARRGGLLDIWPPSETLPVRIEFFGDEIDTLRAFDPHTQRTIRRLDRILITPAREILVNSVEGETNDSPADEFQIPQMHRAVASMLDYLPQRSLVFIDDLGILETTVTEIEEQAVKFRQDSIQEGTLPAQFPIPYLSWSEIQDHLTQHRNLELGYSTAQEDNELANAFSPGPRFGGRLKQVMEELLEGCKAGDRFFIVSRQVSRLQELWKERLGLEETYSCQPNFFESSLSEGITYSSADGIKFHLWTDSEIFGWERPKPRQQHRPSAESPEAVYADLRVGDWVVHIDYGIGRYNGLVRRTLDGIEREFLIVIYEGGDELFVPVHQADRLNRYVGSEGETPPMTRLGTAEWTQTKQRAKQAVQEVAQELLELYTRRQLARGYAFSKDIPWQKELEASFPYLETQDQLKAISDVKRDMESTQPMDRLLCGDVGYGKTEVALRAAFKAVMDGKQVAILVPTTVLAQQHFETFRQRLAAYPVEVEMLSRFRNQRQQDAIVRKLCTANIDIIIGTHRLLQSDVQFKDLGLVIVDEEQRFGVTHKEHLKKLRTEVDVLTLTATPIPRTLYMALTGVRDISTINTPPEERLPIVTHIGPYSPRLVRQSILRELERGGQVFFVHNRVQTIRAMEHHLNTLVPEARLGVGHGQMHEADLSLVMQRFTHGEIDVLLCTSIIESGLDIPNANTLIVDRGDTFGLAQLYQLRGRVGRGAQRAYAYFFRHRRKPPTVEGQERLETIAENTQLGAGYSIAMRDLEMRGAGELLGTRQHGYIASIGFHLYTRLLAQSVGVMRKAAGLPQPKINLPEFREVRSPVSVDLPLNLGVPVTYVPDQNMRLRMYRRMADAQNEGELQSLAEEFADRFGPLPVVVENLFFQIHVKLRAEASGLSSVSVEGDQIVLRYPQLADGMAARNLPFRGAHLRAGKNAYWMRSTIDHPEEWKPILLEALSAIMDILPA
jgi:transcription-repair coupling factor (superfamily II helicase)